MGRPWRNHDLLPRGGKQLWRAGQRILGVKIEFCPTIIFEKSVQLVGPLEFVFCNMQIC